METTAAKQMNESVSRNPALQVRLPPERITIELTRREAALIRRVRELAARDRDCFMVEITPTGFIWREVGKRE